jgi:hypothetical protein
MITLAPMIFLKGSGSGRSLDPKGDGGPLVGRFQPEPAAPSRLVVSAMPKPTFSSLPHEQNTYEPKDGMRRGPAHPPADPTWRTDLSGTRAHRLRRRCGKHLRVASW